MLQILNAYYKGNRLQSNPVLAHLFPVLTIFSFLLLSLVSNRLTEMAEEHLE